MRVSIIIVNYNGRDFIGECLDSVLASNYPDLEIVVVDNASTDGSFEYLKKKYRKDKKVKIVRSDKQLYFTGGSNLGAKTARGEKLIFLNSDTVVDRNFIQELVNFAKDKDKCLVQPKTLFYNQKNVIDNVGGKYNFLGFGFAIGRGEKDQGQYDKNVRIDYANGTCFMIDRKFFEELGGFDEWYRYYYEDVDLNLRARKRRGESWYCYKSVIYHKGSLTFKSNVHNETLLFNIRKNRLRTIIKNFTGGERLFRILALMFVCLAHPQRISLTIKSILSVLNHEHKLLIEKIRFYELKSFVKKRSFSLLDLGCGDGSFLNLARKNGVDVLGVDKAPSTHPRIITSTVEDLRLDKRFDVVTMFHVLEHIDKPESVLKKVKGFLKESGVLVIETPLVGNLTEKLLHKDYFAYHDKGHVNVFTKKEIFELLDKAGLAIKRKGCTLLEFPLTVLTTSFRRGILWGLLGAVLFTPLKILSVLCLNDEIIRLYCVKK